MMLLYRGVTVCRFHRESEDGMTAKIVTIFNQKGGCAKTMTTMQVGGTWGMLGLKVCIIDMDPQNTAKLWSLQATAEAPFPAKC
jgi:chromosome partitioning protein